MQIEAKMNRENKKKWTDLLEEEDLAFIKRFILTSGSLKELARIYGISYPTVRLRLDRLIEKIKILEAYQKTSRFERQLRLAFADGKIEITTLKSLLAAHQKDMEEHHE